MATSVGRMVASAHTAVLQRSCVWQNLEIIVTTVYRSRAETPTPTKYVAGVVSCGYLRSLRNMSRSADLNNRSERTVTITIPNNRGT